MAGFAGTEALVYPAQECERCDVDEEKPSKDCKQEHDMTTRLYIKHFDNHMKNSFAKTAGKEVS